MCVYDSLLNEKEVVYIGTEGYLNASFGTRVLKDVGVYIGTEDYLNARFRTRVLKDVGVYMNRRLFNARFRTHVLEDVMVNFPLPWHFE